MEKALSSLTRMATRRSTKDLSGLDRMSIREHPVGASNYEILDDCGRGVSATVHRALCKPLNEIVAIKKMNLESLNCDLEEIIHEAQTMKNYNHPNVLPLYCSFVSDSDLWMVMPFISGGSVLHIMKYAHSDGLDEVLIATIMRDVLKALEYVHKQGGIHRDIKAGNILIDKEGHVQLGDFGVAASMERAGSWGHDKVARMTFVGTPCWMAPEVMEQTHGYDSSADIWSFGITLLEMAHGHAPFAKFPPMKVLFMTLQNPPPTLDDKGKKHFSKSMREVVSRCLQKDPKQRPTASQLLEHKFFKQAKDERYLAEHMMVGLPPLNERVQEIRQGKAATSAQENDKNFARSQDEYKKGVSAWNFDVNKLKEAAAMEPDEPEEPALPTIAESDETGEGTLSGLGAAKAAAFVKAQGETPSPPPPATSEPVDTAQTNGEITFPQHAPSSGSATSANSAFACLQGQQQLIRETSASVLPPPQYMGPDGASATQSGAVGSEQPSVALEPKQTGVQQASTESAPLSPGAVSPPGLSREGSVQGPLSTATTTPSASKQKIKQQGRFLVSESADAPPATATVSLPVHLELAYASKSQPGIASDGLMARTSEDGIRRPDRGLEGQESVFTDELGGPSGEPKKKGRFLVVESQFGLSKVASSVNLTDTASLGSKSRGDLTKIMEGAGVLGKPPPGPSAVTTPLTSMGGSVAIPSGTGATMPVSVILPRLMEVLDHVNQQQQGMQKLVAALQEAEKGKGPQLLARTPSIRLFPAEIPVAPPGPSSKGPQGSGGGAAAELDAAAESMEAMRARISELEADNLRLKTRNLQLESMLAHATQSGQLQQIANGVLEVAVGGNVAVKGTEIPPSTTPSVQGASPNLSPRDARLGEE